MADAPKPRATSRPSADDLIVAADAYARPQLDAASLFELGAPAPASVPGHPPPLAVEAPRASGIVLDDLRSLAADAAERAWELQRGDGDGCLALAPDRDLARRAAEVLESPELEEMARRADVPTRHLERHAMAWTHGGEEGLEVLAETWMADPELLEEGRTALIDSLGGSLRFADDAPSRPIKQRANTLILGPLQLRLARSGNWYRLVKVNGHWIIDDGPVADPATLFVGR